LKVRVPEIHISPNLMFSIKEHLQTLSNSHNVAMRDFQENSSPLI